MSTAYIDTIDEGELQATRDKTSIVVTYKLKGVSGSTGTAIKVNAANDSNLPLMNATHPDYSGLRVTEKRVTLVDNVAVVAVTYSTATTAPGGDPEQPTVPVYHVSARVTQEQTNAYKNGVPIALYHPDSDLPQPATVTVLKPVITMRVSRVETGINPGVVAQTYVGKVNSTTWQTKSQGWWLCTGIEGNSDDSGTTWRMDYDFELAQQGMRPTNTPTAKSLPWNPIAFYINPATNQPPATPFPGHADFTSGGEFVEVSSYDLIDFNTLNL